MGNNKNAVLIAIAAAAAVAGGAFLHLRGRGPSVPTPAQAPAASSAASPASAPAGAIPEQPLPPVISLEQSDASIRDEIQKWRLGPQASAWLETENIVRRIAAAASIVAEGNSPKDSLSFLGPKTPLRVRRKEGKLYLDPQSYERYDAIGDACQAMDARVAVTLLRRLTPLLDDACRELDCGAGGFEGALTRAIQELLRAPVVVGDVRVRRKVISYAFVDPALERLSLAQKHLVRMGPKNTANIQAKLRQIAGALGVPDERLPAVPAYVPKP